MKPIINPWIIYLINLLFNLNIAVTIVTACLVTALIIFLVFYIDNLGFYDKDSKKMIDSKKTIKKLVIALIFSVILCIAIPSKETMYTMFFLDNITEENIQKIGGTSKDIIDYITNQVDKVVNNNGSKKGNK